MPAVARQGDACGSGVIIASYRGLTVDGVPVACLGDRVSPHGKGKHKSAVLTQASADYTVAGLGVCRIGDMASCGHTITSGSGKHTNDG
jgi:uncharacterized Zn-binding protein involved in type VI secretion